MFKDISIKGKILLLSLITIIIVSVAIAVDSIYSIKDFSAKNIENFKQLLDFYGTILVYNYTKEKVWAK